MHHFLVFGILFIIYLQQVLHPGQGQGGSTNGTPTLIYTKGQPSAANPPTGKLSKPENQHG